MSPSPLVPNSPPRGPVRRPESYAATPAETQNFGTQSSPVKSKRIPASLEEIRTLPEATDKSVDDNFTRDHLSQTPPRDVWWEEGFDSLVAALQKTQSGHEIEMYPTLCDLLSGISKRLHTSLPEALRPKNPIIFIDHHISPPSRHPQKGVLTKPDILAVYGPSTDYTFYKDSTSIYDGVPWHRIISCVEPKTVVKPRVQLSSYLWDHMTARPDMPGVYGLAARAVGYEILWSDASGVIASPLIPWDSDCGPLAGYIYSLYNPPPGHFTHDPSIKANENHDSTMPPRWTIRARGEEYPNCRLLFFGPSWGRRTFVWVITIDGETTVIKDANRDDGRRFCEGQILAEIHNSGVVPGVVRLINWGFVCTDRGVITTVPRCKSDVPNRRRLRLVLGSIGTKLEKAKTVLDLLKAVYDVVEVHRYLSVERNILHRDMSIYNIRMYPTHREQGPKELVKNKPMFIDDVLGDTADPRCDSSRCLLIDLDNSSGPTPFTPCPLDYDGLEVANSPDNIYVNRSTKGAAPLTAQDSIKDLAARTGTPTYIARSIAVGSLLDGVSSKYFSCMPELRGKAKELYLGAYGQAAYDSFTDTDGVFHGGVHSTVAQDGFLHRPRHDIESVFWTLLSSVLRLCPKDTGPEENTNAKFSGIIKVLDSHVIDTHEIDSRMALLDWVASSYRDALHPRLATLAPMLEAMCNQIRPEYAHLSPTPPKEHLHEAMRRLLLRQIVDMGNNTIPLDPEKVRVPTVNGKPITSSRGTKRLYTTAEVLCMEEQSGKRRRRKA